MIDAKVGLTNGSVVECYGWGGVVYDELNRGNNKLIFEWEKRWNMGWQNICERQGLRGFCCGCGWMDATDTIRSTFKLQVDFKPMWMKYLFWKLCNTDYAWMEEHQKAKSSSITVFLVFHSFWFESLSGFPHLAPHHSTPTPINFNLFPINSCIHRRYHNIAGETCKLPYKLILQLNGGIHHKRCWFWFWLVQFHLVKIKNTPAKRIFNFYSIK